MEYLFEWLMFVVFFVLYIGNRYYVLLMNVSLNFFLCCYEISLIVVVLLILLYVLFVFLCIIIRCFNYNESIGGVSEVVFFCWFIMLLVFLVLYMVKVYFIICYDNMIIVDIVCSY